MSTMVFVNFPVTDLTRSINFYEALGFQQNRDFSNEHSAALVWDDNFWIMLLTHDFYQGFIRDKKIANPHTHSGSMVAFSLASGAAVKKFAATAKANGGDFYHLEMGIPEEQMVQLEVEDPDGNLMEPTWMAFS
ncbi:VOC family protein [Enterococcus sp. HY326]|uniref:VOC family protein n=1 Tax=Enterococcus sp. HY326 TaxID=2971265 RepID=UPI00223EE489|nr:VOC family protein [Enterococcus sp. HY326]